MENILFIIFIFVIAAILSLIGHFIFDSILCFFSPKYREHLEESEQNYWHYPLKKNQKK